MGSTRRPLAALRSSHPMNSQKREVLMSQCLQAQGRQAEAVMDAERARASYPGEAQAKNQLVALHMGARRHEAALVELLAFEHSSASMRS